MPRTIIGFVTVYLDLALTPGLRLIVHCKAMPNPPIFAAKYGEAVH
jgi:hypothetical protein